MPCMNPAKTFPLGLFPKYTSTSFCIFNHGNVDYVVQRVLKIEGVRAIRARSDMPDQASPIKKRNTFHPATK